MYINGALWAGKAALIAAGLVLTTTGSALPAQKTEATYLGVADYGAAETNKDNRDHFGYRFEIDGREVVLPVDNGPSNDESDSYPIQNVLKEGYSYTLDVKNGAVTAAAEHTNTVSYEPPVSGTPGRHTLENFLRTALEPVGTTLYIYGGGWDWQDEGSAIQTRTIGVSPDWVRFFNEQDENFTYRDRDGDAAKKDPATSYYPYGGYNEYYYAGLDCSGYVGWTLYNTLHSESGGAGYVGGSTGFAKRLADLGYGSWTQDVLASPMKPGDVMSINGHVWISLGTCADGSVVIAHSTPSYSRAGQPGGGVQIGAIGPDEQCEAYQLADRYMARYYPEWYRRYAVSLKDPGTYFTFTGEKAGRFSWNVTGADAMLTDPSGYQQRTPAEVLAGIFGA